MAVVEWRTHYPELSEQNLRFVARVIPSQTPIIALSDGYNESCVVSALDAGADQFIGHDVTIPVLDAMTKSMVRRLKLASGASNRIGNVNPARVYSG